MDGATCFLWKIPSDLVITEKRLADEFPRSRSAECRRDTVAHEGHLLTGHGINHGRGARIVRGTASS